MNLRTQSFGPRTTVLANLEARGIKAGETCAKKGATSECAAKAMTEAAVQLIGDDGVERDVPLRALAGDYHMKQTARHGN